MSPLALSIGLLGCSEPESVRQDSTTIEDMAIGAQCELRIAATDGLFRSGRTEQEHLDNQDPVVLSRLQSSPT